MPYSGEIRLAREIGKKGYFKYIWHTCIKCGKERWVKLCKGKPRSLICRPCNVRGEANHKWKGKCGCDKRGYVKKYASRSDFFYPMAIKSGKSAYYLEHRLIMAKHLGRCLHSWEIVHHKGTKFPMGSMENKGDNRIENLQVVSDSKHNGFTILEREINRLKAVNKKLKEENKCLRNQLKKVCVIE